MQREIEIEFGGWSIGEQAYHRYTGVVGRVVGLYAGLHAVQLQLQYIDKSDVVREDWFAIDECEEAP